MMEYFLDNKYVFLLVYAKVLLFKLNDFKNEKKLTQGRFVSTTAITQEIISLSIV